MIRHACVVTAALALVVGCDDKKSETTTTGAPTQVTAKPNADAKPVDKTVSEPKKSEPVLTFKKMMAPESVLYDADNDLYLATNVAGKPLEADGKAWISKLSPDGKVVTEKWIESGVNKVTMNAPKGMAIANGMLYVADLDTVRMFDRTSGEARGEVKIPNTTFLNDIAAQPDGTVWVTETGMKAKGSDFEPTGQDAVYAIDKNKKLTTVAKTHDLGNPNGIVVGKDGKDWLVSFGSNELYSLDAKGKKSDVTKIGKGTLDGVQQLPDGDMLVTSWDSKSIWRGKPGGEFKEIIGDVKSPADIALDTKRSRLIVPMLEENEIRVYDIK